MKTKFLTALTFFLCIGLSNADAQIKHRAQNQHQRIRHGVKSGELTRAETKNLVKDQRELHQDVRLAKI